MNKLGNFIAHHRRLVLIIATLLLLPALYGHAMTKINYDILTYLPEGIDSVNGQKIQNEVFGSSANGMLVIENMQSKEIIKLKEKIKEVEGVDNVVWVDDIADTKIPKSMLPEAIKDLFYSENSTLLLISFTEDSSSKLTQSAIDDIKGLMDERAYLSGLSAILKDTKDLAGGQTGKYIFLAVSLATIILLLTLESTVVPFIILISIGYAVVYNAGTNILFGEISYITNSLAAVLQLGVTLDYSIFLLHRYEEESLKIDNKEDAMAEAINKTASSIIGSSLTTIAGFLAIAAMELTIGKDIGFVMAKGVLLGVISVLTVLPSLILTFDKVINRFRHKTLLPEFNHLSDFVINHYKKLVVIGLIALVPAFYGNANNDIFYNMDESLPDDLDSIVATNKLKEDFNMTTTHMIIMSNNVKNYEVKQMISEIEHLDGVTGAIAYQKLIGPAVPEKFLPEEIKDIFEKGDYKRIIVNSEYKSATKKQNHQIDKINEIVKKYDSNAMVAGEGALTKDLIDIADRDFKRVNTFSNLAVFTIIMLVFRSISIPFILVLIIQLAIMINMSIPFYASKSIPFISSIVVGSIQLGATVDYAILMTTRFREEINEGKDKFEAMKISITEGAKSITISGLAFFASTIGVAAISDIEITKSLSGMIAKGALISTVVILLVLPGILLLSESLISRTSKNWKKSEKSIRSKKGSVVYDNK